MAMHDNQHTCVYAVEGLKKNSTRLLVAMCVGLALALYGVYVQARTTTNPTYKPSLAMASHWLYNQLSHTITHTASMMSGCGRHAHHHHQQHFLTRHLIRPVLHSSSLINGFINLAQIIVLKVYCKSLRATALIMAMSCVGFVVSMICLGGAVSTCKTMCLSCLGLHHLFIVYYGMRRYRIIQNLFCPPANTNQGACTYDSSSSTGKKPPTSGASSHKSSASSRASPAAPAGTAETRRRR